jgi:predicted GTPase
LAEEIRKFTTANIQLVNDKLGIKATNAKLEADKNKLINEKNILVVKREKLRTELAVIRAILAIALGNANTKRNKFKAKRLLLFDSIKENLQLFFIKI